MINYWWVTRPKRKLNSIPEVLAAFVSISLNQEWQGQIGSHISFEDALEKAGLKRVGERRDQRGSGGRTYAAWIASLGLVFRQESTGKTMLTLAGEAIISGETPVTILKNQILKYQFPSSFSLSRGVMVSERFRIRPFRFLLRLLNDYRLGYYLTQEEIAKVVIVEAENESEQCFEYIVNKIISFRAYGDQCLEPDFARKYGPSRGNIDYAKPYKHLLDVANTLINWIEYTQLAKRDDENKLVILNEKRAEVQEILSYDPPFIDRPEEHEYYQRKYGVDPNRSKDTRNLANTRTITPQIIAEQQIKQIFLKESLSRPIGAITPQVIDEIASESGFEYKIVEDTLLQFYPHGAIGSFMTEYFEMAFRGRDDSIEFEKATAEIFNSVFGFESHHIGPAGLTPDVLIVSDSNQYIGIIDNKAYSKYSITNDHRNRMIHNYINTYKDNQKYPLAFFSYISGGFTSTINQQVISIVKETKVSGSAMPVTILIKMIENHKYRRYTHGAINEIFSLNRQVSIADI